MVLGDVEREAVNGGDVENVGDGLVVLVVLGPDVADTLIEVPKIQIYAISLHFFSLVGEVIAAIALNLRDQQR